jgi:hypothetical protein
MTAGPAGAGGWHGRAQCQPNLTMLSGSAAASPRPLAYDEARMRSLPR